MEHDCDDGWLTGDYGSWPCSICQPDTHYDWMHGTIGGTP